MAGPESARISKTNSQEQVKFYFCKILYLTIPLHTFKMALLCTVYASIIIIFTVIKVLISFLYQIFRQVCLHMPMVLLAIYTV